ncbi:putative oxidoreductase, partial [Gordonia hirsuta DSM 44140 = NBRC 16056]
AAPGLLLAALAGSGWPIARGGSQAIADALAAIIGEHGGVIETGHPITRAEQLPPGARWFFDTSPRAMAAVLGDRLPPRYRRTLQRFRYGPGTCKVDFLLREPIPWGQERYTRTATFHLADDYGQIARAEAQVAAGVIPERPWVLGGEPTRIDPSRAPAGTHLAWAYCHVPAGCPVDVSAAIIAQIERCAPGFRDVIEATIVTTASEQAAQNPNNVGGDIGAGATSLRQLIRRPVLGATPQATPLPGIYLCSAATAPGGGVHGMSGYRASRHAQSSRAADRS